MTYTNFAIEALKHRLVEKAVKNGTPKKFGCDMFEAYEVIVHLQKQVAAAETDLAARQSRMALHGCCVECDFWDESDPRCMCDKSQWAGLTVKADNYCGSFERRNDLLTLEELLKMKGEPVWIVWHDGRVPSKWWIVGGYDWNLMEYDDDLTQERYGKTWLAYRHKTKEAMT